MAKTRTGKNIRIPEMAITQIQVVRARMMATAHIGGLQLNRADVPSDGMVVAFSLAMTERLMNPKFALIDRPKFLATLDREIAQRVPEFASRTPAERLAFIDLLMASCCEFSAYNPDSPLNAMATEGRQPS